MPNGERGFLSLARRVAQRSGLEGMLPVIEKELLHYEIFQALDDARLLERLTFQGGTCLRLCYGSERYSEDLDFAGGSAFDFEELPAIVESAEFRAQMTRFLPPSVVARTVDRPMFREHMVERIQGLYRLANEGLGC